ncbi:MAG TPA: hypothetical protein VFS21_27550 [Roseiflexaceae bacterium]|nr:hypothetical protein [Roseiflexaceae bacterium]
MTGPQLTEERLRSWLDSNQVQQERLCTALLALNRSYTHVRPRRPKGGPDGGRDIEARYEGLEDAWGAVGFRNSVKDSSADKKWVKNKFTSDVKRALEEKPDLKVFAFFTNVDLTPSEITELQRFGKQQGLSTIDIFERERIRILLDGSEGLGFRYQYLNIPLSEAEQAAFFERFGTQLEQIILQKFTTIEQQLEKIEFLSERLQPCKNLGIVIYFKEEVIFREMDLFAFQVKYFDRNRKLSVVFTVQSNPVKLVQDIENQTHLSLTSSVEFYNPNDKRLISYYQNYIASAKELEIQENLSFVFATLGDFDGADIYVYMTQSIIDCVAKIDLLMNGYSVASIDMSIFQYVGISDFKDGDISVIEWPATFDAQWREQPWVRIITRELAHIREKIGNGYVLPPLHLQPTCTIDFGSHLPKRYQEAWKKRS